MDLTYKFNVVPPAEIIIDLYESSGINRPTTDKVRISKMYANSNLIVSLLYSKDFNYILKDSVSLELEDISL